MGSKTASRSTFPFAVLTPITEEFEAIEKRLANPTPRSTVRNHLIATSGFIGPNRIICVKSGKGQERAALALSAVVQECRPRWILLVGIAGGLPNRGIFRGDVVVARHVHCLDYGKIAGGTYTRRPDYDQSPAPLLLSHAEAIAEGMHQSWKTRILLSRPDRRAATRSTSHVAIVASGNKVVDSLSNAFISAALEHSPEAAAIEMEGTGAATATWLCQQSDPLGFLMIRGVSDEIAFNDDKAHRAAGTTQRTIWKRYAADVAAAFAAEFVATFPRDANAHHDRQPAATPPERQPQQGTLPAAIDSFTTRYRGRGANSLRHSRRYDCSLTRASHDLTTSNATPPPYVLSRNAYDVLTVRDIFSLHPRPSLRAQPFTIIFSLTEDQLDRAFAESTCIFRELLTLSERDQKGLHEHFMTSKAPDTLLAPTAPTSASLITIECWLAATRLCPANTSYDPAKGLVLSYLPPERLLESGAGYEFDVMVTIPWSRRHPRYPIIYAEPTQVWAVTFDATGVDADPRAIPMFTIARPERLVSTRKQGRIEFNLNGEWVLPTSGVLIYWEPYA